MTLIKQVLSDLFKEIGWIVLYGFLTAMTIMTFILIGESYKQVAGQNSSISRFVQNNVYMAQIKGLEFSISEQTQSSDFADAAEPVSAGGYNSMEELEAYFEFGFSSEGNLGSYISLPYKKGGYDNLILYLGKYADLTQFSRPNGQSTVFASSPDLKEMVGKPIQTGAEEITISSVVPDNMDLYHPLYYVPADSENLRKTLYVFTEDYSLAKKLFPQISAGYLLDRLILVNPTEHDLTELREIMYETTGTYTGVQSVKNHLAASEASGTRTHQTYLLFYISASIALMGAMLLNMARALNGMMQSYTIHHLFGASGKFIFLRMQLFTVGYNVIPVLGALFIMSLNMLLSPKNVLLLMIAALGIEFLITVTMYKRFKIKFSQGLRRE